MSYEIFGLGIGQIGVILALWFIASQLSGIFHTFWYKVLGERGFFNKVWMRTLRPLIHKILKEWWDEGIQYEDHGGAKAQITTLIKQEIADGGQVVVNLDEATIIAITDGVAKRVNGSLGGAAKALNKSQRTELAELQTDLADVQAEVLYPDLAWAKDNLKMLADVDIIGGETVAKINKLSKYPQALPYLEKVAKTARGIFDSGGKGSRSTVGRRHG